MQLSQGMRFHFALRQIHSSFEKLRETFKTIGGEMHELVVSAKNGDLAKRIDASRFEGEWGEITNSLKLHKISRQYPVAT